jgi:hypothetical protein
MVVVASGLHQRRADVYAAEAGIVWRECHVVRRLDDLSGGHRRPKFADRIHRLFANGDFVAHCENQRMQRTRDAVCGCSFVSGREPLILRVLLLPKPL